MLTYNSLIVIISSPSGVGKTTITKKLLQKIDKSYLSISCTTRNPRKNEKNKKDYFFITKKKFFQYKKEKKFLEVAKVHSNYYGTLKSELIKKKNKKEVVLLDIDWQGARNIRKKIKNNCYSFFLLPPSISILKKRLLKRHSDNKILALSRLSSARKDLKYWDEYDYIYINNKLNKCVNEILKKIKMLIYEKNKKSKLKTFVKKI